MRIKRIPMRETSEERIALYEWLASQREWHRVRIGGNNARWHLSQYNWYRLQAREALTFNDMVTRTLVGQGQPLLSRFKGKAKNHFSRRAVRVPIHYDD